MTTICKSNRQHTPLDKAKAVVPFLNRAMRKILGNDTKRVSKSPLRLCKRDPMLILIMTILRLIPLKMGLRHGDTLP